MERVHDRESSSSIAQGKADADEKLTSWRKKGDTPEKVSRIASEGVAESSVAYLTFEGQAFV